MPVLKGDIIQIADEDKWVKQPVEWMGKWNKHMQENYYQVEFNNTREDEAERSSILFISEEKKEEFKAKATKIDSGFSVTVDDTFRYGEREKDKNRFLVFQRKEIAIMQHRFLAGSMPLPGGQGTDLMCKLGFEDGKLLSTTAIASIMGRKLCEFK